MTEPLMSHSPPHPQPSTTVPASSPAKDPPTNPDTRSPPPQMTRETILRALDDVAASLDSQGVTTRAIALGGIVDTLYLRTRNTTTDINLFLPHTREKEHDAVLQAARHANQQARGTLGDDWLSNAAPMRAGMQGRLGGEAFGQNVVVYERGGLRLYAAPWEYAFCERLRRLVSAEGRRSDAEDAVRYLREHLRARRVRRVRVGTIRNWCQRYREGMVADEVLRRVNEVYGERFGSQPIVWKAPAEGKVRAVEKGGDAGAVKKEGEIGTIKTKREDIKG